MKGRRSKHRLAWVCLVISSRRCKLLRAWRKRHTESVLRTVRKPVSGIVTLLSLGSNLIAQRAFEKNDKVVYEDAAGRQADLGIGFSPVLTADGRVALIRGRPLDSDLVECGRAETKNWIAIYDPATMREKTIFDRALDYGRPGTAVCNFEQMQLSHDSSVLYLVSLVYATSGSLAIVDLTRGSVQYVPGVNEVYVIETGAHRDELVYQRRILGKVHGEKSPYYPFIHARADGTQIKVIAEESFTVGGNDKVPRLRAYLRAIRGTITVNGRRLP